MATFFEQALLRLKDQLQVQTDKEVAKLLGMAPTSFNERKKRDSFPRDKLMALAVTRPDLHIDVHYVLADFPTLSTSLAHQQAARAAAQQDAAALAALSSEERVLLDYFRQASPPVRKAALGALLSAVPEARVSGGIHQTSHAQGGVQVGLAMGQVKVKTKGKKP